MDLLKDLANMDFNQPEISMDQAQEISDAFIKEMGLSHMVLATTELAVRLQGVAVADGDAAPSQNNETAYVLRYRREVNGATITYSRDSGSSVEEEEAYVAGWPYESILFVINDDGIVEFQWISPYTEPNIVTEDTKLLTFPEIQQVFEKMILIKNSWIDDTSTKVQMDVDTVQLGLMRITDPDQRNSGILIPVWDFFGTTTYENETDQWSSNPRDSLLTINAVVEQS